MPLVPASGEQKPWWAGSKGRGRRSSGGPSGPRLPDSGDSPGSRRELDQALRKRRAAQRRRKLRFAAFILARLALAAVLGFGIVSLVRYPGWRIAEVEVQGLYRVGADEVRSLAGVGPGDSLVFLKKSAVVERVESHPRIKAARVSRRIPSALVVEVQERMPYLDLVEGRRHILVDSEGIVLGVESEPPAVSVHTLRIRDAGEVVPGEPLPFDGAFELLEFNRRVDPRVRALITGKLLTGDGELIVYTEAEVPFKLRMSQDWSKRLDLMPSILERIRIDGLKVKYVDLRPAGAPYMKLENETAAVEAKSAY